MTRPLNLQVGDLHSMPHHEAKATDRDSKEHQYGGIPLIDLFQQAGATVGGDLRGANLMKYVVKAVDGYQVLLALPELAPDFTSRTILLADRVNSSPLPTGAGLYRLIMPGEKKPARRIWQGNVIEVRVTQ
ncbi:molybdopterin-binding protein [Fibrella sp. HMF5335]|uniref:Molybdopterin-binding protein n=1 Tax=Fibrella rubiginis TaxID=2817060 RepID=A0A939GF51_9BACT|nr:molybdopterin-binding protein [Fibrella rubiginis]MBO0936350.1 molybdopterin-binding protein [Fibrella rubiginis]